MCISVSSATAHEAFVLTQNMRNGVVLAAMCLATFMAILDTSLVNLGLRAIQADLHARRATLQWVIDLYNLAYAVLILTGGTLGDRYGRRRIFVIGVVTFAAGSLVCAVAPDAGVLIAGRGIAGAGAALELPAALAILNVTYPDPHARAGAITLWGGMNGLAMAIGPTVGGLLVDSLGWRSLFYAVLPFAAATLALPAFALEESRNARDRHLDLPGQVLAIVALGTLALGFIEGPGWGWRSPPILGCTAACIASAAAFIAVERRTAAPMLPLSIFRNAAFSAAVADATLMAFGMYELLFLLPLYLQVVRHDSAVRAGVTLLPMSLTFFLVSPLAGWVATRVGPRVLIGGGFAWMAAAAFCVGLGLGCITGPIATAAPARSPLLVGGRMSAPPPKDHLTMLGYFP